MIKREGNFDDKAYFYRILRDVKLLSESRQFGGGNSAGI